MTVSNALPGRPEQYLLEAESLLARRDVLAAAAAFDSAERIGADRNRCAAGRWMASMLAGDFAAAWRESDAINMRAGGDPHLFHRGEGLRDSRVTVRCLHGLGDTVHFLRYLPKLRLLTSHLAIELPPPLIGVAPHFRGVGQGVGSATGGEERPSAASAASELREIQVEIMDLPYLFRTTPRDLPVASRYLELPPGMLRKAAWTMGPRRRPRVGLVWAAGAWNPGRSIPIALIALFLRNPECEIWNLQGGRVREELRAQWTPAPLRDTVECGEGILALAATISCLDLVITIDTLAAHLAGALGQPAWVLLQQAADWRWMIERESNPWYPSLRLFRQPCPGDWQAVIDSVREELDRWLRNNARRSAA